MLALYDFLCLLLALWLACHWYLPGPAVAGRGFVLRGALLGSSLGPLILHDHHFVQRARSGKLRPLLGAQAVRFATCAAMVGVLAVICPVLAGASAAWMATWIGLGVGAMLLGRLGLLRMLDAGRTPNVSEFSAGTSGDPAPSLGDSACLDLIGHGVPVWVLAERPIPPRAALLKSAADLALAATLLVLLAPLMVLIAVAIRIDSPGPVLFRQRRHAIDNREFRIWKFRTMRWHAAGTGECLQQTLRGDPRVTRLGGLLRASSLDELPQLFNVLAGQMSLVGPRPHAVDMRTENRLGQEINGRYAHRHRVKPGITGWAQINGARGATDTSEQLCRRIELDLFYIDHWSVWLDLKILLLTVREVLRRDNAY